MYGFLSTAPWVGDLPDPGRDLALAERAVTYLRGRGLDDQAVVQCLLDEFGIDLATAETMASPPRWAMDLGASGAAGGLSI